MIDLEELWNTAPIISWGIESWIMFGLLWVAFSFVTWGPRTITKIKNWRLGLKQEWES